MDDLERARKLAAEIRRKSPNPKAAKAPPDLLALAEKAQPVTAESLAAIEAEQDARAVRSYIEILDAIAYALQFERNSKDEKERKDLEEEKE